MILKSADPTPQSSGTTPDFFTDPPRSPAPTSPKPNNTITLPSTVFYVDVHALIMSTSHPNQKDDPANQADNCSLFHPGPFTLATSYSSNTWTAQVSSYGSYILFSASAPDIHGALNALHHKSASAIASRLAAPPGPPGYAEIESYSKDQDKEEEEEDEEDEDEDEEEDDDKVREEYALSWGPVSEPYTCCGCGHNPGTRTRLLPVTRRVTPQKRMIPRPPPRTAPPSSPLEDIIPPPPRPPTSPYPPPAILRSPIGGPRLPPKDNVRED